VTAGQIAATNADGVTVPSFHLDGHLKLSQTACLIPAESAPGRWHACLRKLNFLSKHAQFHLSKKLPTFAAD
jgi:hypothetical protein